MPNCSCFSQHIPPLFCPLSILVTTCPFLRWIKKIIKAGSCHRGNPSGLCFGGSQGPQERICEGPRCSQTLFHPGRGRRKDHSGLLDFQNGLIPPGLRQGGVADLPQNLGAAGARGRGEGEASWDVCLGLQESPHPKGLCPQLPLSPGMQAGLASLTLTKASEESVQASFSKPG